MIRLPCVISFFFTIFICSFIYSFDIQAQTLPPYFVLKENFHTKEQLKNWNFFTPEGCSIDISGYESHMQYGTPFSPEGGNDLLISRTAGNFECYASYFPPEEVKSNGYVSLWVYDNLGQNNDLNFLAIVKNTKGDTVSLAMRKAISPDEYVLRINGVEHKTGVKRSMGWQFFEYFLVDGQISTRLNSVKLNNYLYPTNFDDITEVRLGAGWGTRQAIRIDWLVVKKEDIYYSPYCFDDICKLLDFPNFPIDSNVVFTQTGKTKQIVTVGGYYYFRDDVNTNEWYSRPLFENEVNNTGVPFPTSLDTNTIYPFNGGLAQTITKDNKWWYRASTTGPWTNSGIIFSRDVNNTGCVLPSKLDSSTVYPTPSKTGVLSHFIVNGDTYWYKQDVNGPWTECGKFLSSIEEPIDSHTIFFENSIRYDIVTTNALRKKWIVKNISFAQKNTNVSSLWGKTGEVWNPLGRLPDFSYAGYHAGEKHVPFIPVKTNVKDFGAKGDGIADDTSAFKQALLNTQDGAIWIPSGRYKITDVLYIQKSNIVLRGEGSGVNGSVLVFPKSLTTMAGAHPTYKYGLGGVISVGHQRGDGWVNNLTGSNKVNVVNSAKKGDRVLRLSNTSSIKVGDYILLSMRESTDRSMQESLHYGVDSLWCSWQPPRFLWTVMVTGVSGQNVTLKQPLRIDVDLKWQPEVYTPQLYREVGIEHLRIEFPPLPTPGHLEELGYNGIEYRGVLNGWINNVVMENADNGASIIASKHISILGLNITNKNRKPNQVGTGSYYGSGYGHHGISFVVGSSDNLLSDFSITRFAHDITLQDLVSGNVIKDSQGQDLSLDHHGNIQFENLFSNLNMGLGFRTYNSSGEVCSGPHAGRSETFWNLKYNDSQVRAGVPLSFDLFSRSNVIGASEDLTLLNRDVFMERINNLEPSELYQSQFTFRANKENIKIYAKADLNKDGKVDQGDFRLLGQIIFNNPTEYIGKVADIKNDGKLNIFDINFLLQ